VISGIDLTAEAAYAKMVIFLAEEAARPFEEIGDLLQLDVCGEQSQSIFYVHYDANSTLEEEGGIYQALLTPRSEVIERYRLRRSLEHVTHIQLRLLGLEPVREDKKPLNRAIELDVALVDPSREPRVVVARLRADMLRWFAKGRNTINIAYDISEYRNQVIRSDNIPSTILRIQTNEPIHWKRAAIVIFVNALNE
jgi:hypothetical protein